MFLLQFPYLLSNLVRPIKDVIFKNYPPHLLWHVVLIPSCYKMLGILQNFQGKHTCSIVKFRYTLNTQCLNFTFLYRLCGYFSKSLTTP